MKITQPLTTVLGALAALQQTGASPVPAHGGASHDLPNRTSMGAAPRNGTTPSKPAALASRESNDTNAATTSQPDAVKPSVQHAEGLGLFGSTALIGAGMLRSAYNERMGPMNALAVGLGAGGLVVSGAFHGMHTGKPREGQPADPAECANVAKQHGLATALVAETGLAATGLAYGMFAQTRSAAVVGSLLQAIGNVALGVTGYAHGQEVAKPRC